MTAVFERIAIIGAGLIGGSIARAAKEKGAAGAISIFDGDPDVRKRAAEIGLGEVCATAAPWARRGEPAPEQ
jgi:cyclohexadieny/prephenate dehydrogenase